MKILEGHVYTTASIRAPQYHIKFGGFEVVMDTGSPETFITEGIAFQLNIPVSKLPFEKHVKIGGNTFEFRKMLNVTLYFINNEGGSEKIELPIIYVALSVKRDKDSLTMSYSLPAVLGTDFLLKNKLAFYCSPYKNIAYFEKVED